jgi:hypothetical protein
MTSKLPSETARARLEHRARKTLIETGKKGLGRLTEAQKKTPSQKRSEAGRRKLRRGSIASDIAVQETSIDCHQCPSYTSCYNHLNLHTCHRRSDISECKRCGRIYQHPVIPGVSWIYCKDCEGEK